MHLVTVSDPLHNDYRHWFTHRGIKYHCAEQAIIYRKAVLFAAPKDLLEEIMAAPDAVTCRALGRDRRLPFNRDIWERRRVGIARSVLRDKFKVGSRLYRSLMETPLPIGVVIEHDSFWGVGPVSYSVRRWSTNTLGTILTELIDQSSDEDQID